MLTTKLQELCADIRTIIPDAVIAGGAVRDSLSCKPIKDIDVMTGTAITRALMRKLADHMGGYVENADASTASGDESFEYIINFEDQRLPLNVIDLNFFEIKDPIANVFDFDFGLSQVAVIPEGVLHTEAYIRDAMRQSITYMGDRGRSKWRIESSARRMARLKRKYPNHFFRNCESLLELEAF